LSESITLEQLAEAVITDSVQQYLYPADKALERYPAILLDAETTERVKHGNAFRTPGEGHSDLARVYDANDHFLAIAEWDEEQEAWQPKKVFSTFTS